jgi:hypothetical protein
MTAAPGQCADGSGGWYPLLKEDGGIEPVCPSDPRFAYVKWLHESGEYKRELQRRWQEEVPYCPRIPEPARRMGVALMPSLGAIPIVQLCPECSYMTETGCVWCPETGAENIPECFDCIGHQKKADPWYKNPDFMVPIVATVVATVVSAMLLKRLRLG